MDYQRRILGLVGILGGLAAFQWTQELPSNLAIFMAPLVIGVTGVGALYLLTDSPSKSTGGSDDE